MAEPKNISQARKMGKSYFIGKDGKRKAAVTKEELKKSGLSLRDYLNKQQGKTRRSAAKVAPKPKARPSKRVADTGQRPDNRSVKSTPKSKVPTAQRKTPEDILGTREKSRAARRARQEAKTKKDTSMTPEEKLKGQIGISAAAAALLGPGAIPILMRVAAKHGPAFARSLGNKIKNLTSGQQKNVVQAANNAATKTKAQQQTSQMLRAAQRTQSSRQPLKKDRVEPYIKKENKPLTPGQSRTARLVDAAKQSQRKEFDPGYTGGALKKGGPIVARKGSGSLKAVDKQKNPGLAKLPSNVRNRMGYAKSGGKVVNRKGGGRVGSGNDLVASIYD